MFRGKPSDNLETLVDQFNGEVYIQKYFNSPQNPKESLIWLLIKFFAININEPEILHRQLLTYKNVSVYPKGQKHH